MNLRWQKNSYQFIPSHIDSHYLIVIFYVLALKKFSLSLQLTQQPTLLDVIFV